MMMGLGAAVRVAYTPCYWPLKDNPVPPRSGGLSNCVMRTEVIIGAAIVAGLFLLGGKKK